MQPGERFGRLVVVDARRSMAKFKCDCGAEKEIQRWHVKAGRVQSCGCLLREKSRERAIARNTTHGMARTALYNLWSGIIDRCTNPNAPAYKRYGGRGITVCERWKSFENFYADMGDRPTIAHSVERRNNNKGYSPNNCFWGTRKEQANNKQTNVLLRYKNKTQTMKQWSEELGLNYSALQHRRTAGWTTSRMLSTPIRRRAK